MPVWDVSPHQSLIWICVSQQVTKVSPITFVTGNVFIPFVLWCLYSTLHFVTDISFVAHFRACMQWLPLPHDLSPDNSILLSFCRPHKTHIAQEWLAESPVMNVTYTQYSQPTPFLPLFPTTVRQHPWELNLLPSMQWWMLYISIWFYTMITMTSLQPTQVQGLGYMRSM